METVPTGIVDRDYGGGLGGDLAVVGHEGADVVRTGTADPGAAP
jgi:hypothetical protein